MSVIAKESKMTSLNYNLKELGLWDMSNDEIMKLMKTERFSLTCAPGGENNRGMEIIGRMPIKGEGFTAKDIEGLGPYFQKLMAQSLKEGEKVTVLNLNALSGKDYCVYDLDDDDQARVLILRDWAAKDGWCRGLDETSL